MKKISFAKTMVLAALMAVSGIASADVVFATPASNNCFPFGCGAMNYQQVYGAAGFTDKVTITGISFKSAQDVGGRAFSDVPVSVTFDLSTTAVNPYTISTDFAGNRGSDDAIVFSGTTLVSSTGANLFEIIFPFTSSFTYDPSKGNLLVGMNVTSSQGLGQFEAGDSGLVGRNFTWASASNGLATKFLTGSAVPEPGTVALLLAGVGLMGFMVRRRKR